jgi:hypothetical protein
MSGRWAQQFGEVPVHSYRRISWVKSVVAQTSAANAPRAMIGPRTGLGPLFLRR